MHKQIVQYLLFSCRFTFLLLALFSSALVAGENAGEAGAIKKPNDIELFAQAVQLSSQNLWAQAEPIYRELIQRNKEWPEPANNLAIVLFKTNRIDEARALLEQAVISSPSYRVTQNNRTHIYNYLAAQAYDKALGSNHTIMPPELEIIETIYQPVKIIEIEVEKIVEQSEREALSPVVNKPNTNKPDVHKPVDMPANIPSDQRESIGEQIKQRLNAWSRAWSQGDFDYYIQTYSKDFLPSDARKTFSEWKNIRRAKLKFTQSVNVDIERLRVFVEPHEDALSEHGHDVDIEARFALVEFIQKYNSKSYSDKVLKQLYMSRQQGEWLILSERTIKIY